MPGTRTPPPDDVDRIERALGWRPTSFRPATADRGASDTAARWIVADDNDLTPGRRSAFVKIGATETTADWTRTEYRNYRSLRGRFLPEVLGFDDDGDRPALALEDLSRADWPPPWTDERVAAVRDALAAIARTPPPDHFDPPGGHAPALAAWVAGYFCARAGKAPLPEAPHVRPLQAQQSRIALPWAARALGLPPP